MPWTSITARKPQTSSAVISGTIGEPLIAERPKPARCIVVRRRRGLVVVERGMTRQGYDLQLTRYDERGWRATFYTTGMEHSPTSASGTSWERTPWHATQRAAWETLKGGQRQ